MVGRARCREAGGAGLSGLARGARVSQGRQTFSRGAGLERGGFPGGMVSRVSKAGAPGGRRLEVWD